MFPQNHINGFEKYWRRRKPNSSTAIHYSSDVNKGEAYAYINASEAIINAFKQL